ncbi:hypothetical protein AAU57_13865 [Nonlabens sp. YIK11]|uniref:hypothetical protein n=1 Tax=Nonlabens sp. YIK11 TaxID=1453349 RepID=UPI000707A109|nr:hypothetical protein [Nonlabens sp. YIK11]KQC34303.1 hypothetical protein AAU57_13865 [Nonlabens sp. YIK11]
MKNIFTLIMAVTLSTGFFAQAQIGVNTNAPTANLDVNGTLRVRSLDKTNESFQATGDVVYIMGVDANGNVIPIEIDENIVLEGNKLRVQLPATDPTPSELPNGQTLEELYEPGSDALINDMDLGIVILPGDRRGSKPVIRLSNDTNNEEVTITGFKAASDGTMAFIYPTSGTVKILKENESSSEENRIYGGISANDYTVKKNEMLLVMYDAQIKRWVVVSKF